MAFGVPIYGLSGNLGRDATLVMNKTTEKAQCIRMSVALRDVFGFSGQEPRPFWCHAFWDCASWPEERINAKLAVLKKGAHVGAIIGRLILDTYNGAVVGKIVVYSLAVFPKRDGSVDRGMENGENVGLDISIDADVPDSFLAN